MMYNQNLDIQVWKLHAEENGEYGNKIKLMEIVGEFNREQEGKGRGEIVNKV